LQWSAVVGTRSGRSASAIFEVALVKYPFHVRKQMTLSSENDITVVETVENKSEQTLPFSWLIHPTFSWDFVGSGALLDIPAETISRMDSTAKTWDAPEFVDSDGKKRRVNEMPSKDSVLDSTLVLSDLRKGRYAVRSEKLRLAFELSWDKKVFPYLWYYRSINAQNYPYFGRSRFIALEPCTSRYSGLAKQVEESDAPALGPGEKLTTTIVARVKRK
jgi:galactose mutarotase-like enzyme